MNVDYVAGLDEGVAVALAGPFPIIGQQDDLVGADTGVNLEGQGAGDQGVDVVAGAGLHGPVGVLVVFEGTSGGEDVFQLARPVLTGPAMAALVGSEAVGHGAVGGLLQVKVEGGLNFQAGFVDLLGTEAFFELAADFFLEPGRHRALRLGDVQAQRGIAGLLGLDVGDDSVGLHFTEDEVAAAQGFVRIEQRRKGYGRLGQAGQESRFSQVEVFGVFGEEKLRGGFETVHAVAEVDLVAVKGEDLLLGEGALDLDGEIGFLHFAGGGALGGEEEVAGQLHGERGGALGASVGADVMPDRADDAEGIDAPVGLEALVFNGDDGLAEDGGKAVVADDLAALEGKGADDAALAVIEIGGGGGAVALEVADLGQIDGIDQREAGQRTGGDGQNEQGDEGEAAGQLAMAVRGNRLHLRPVVTAWPDKGSRFERL